VSLLLGGALADLAGIQAVYYAGAILLGLAAWVGWCGLQSRAGSGGLKP